MTKTFERSSYPPPPEAPEPAVNSAADGLSIAREQARKYLLNAVFLWAAIAFGNGEASLWTRLQAA
jgi:hypothetical protein